MASRVAIVIIFSLLACSLPVGHTTFVGNVCGTNGNYTSNSIYNQNLDNALANLSFAANASNSGFYNVSAGQDLNRVNAIVLCRGDVQPDICRSCVKDSINNLRELCPNQKEAVEWHDECMLRYSNDWILNNLVTDPTRELLNVNNASDMVQFNQDLRNLLDDLKGRAIQKKFATGNISGPAFLTIYGLMQCTPDLSSTQCSDCFDEAMRDLSFCCSGKVGGQVMKPSCRLRFEVVRFYNETITVNAPPPRPRVPPPPSSVPPPGKDDNTARTIIIVVVVVGSCILFLILFCIYKRKDKHRSATETSLNDNGEDISSVEFLQYDFTTIEIATDFFSDVNKLGQGGFGAVYKGTLRSGQEVAVKRLSRGSNQGEQEFKNEVSLVAQLQHRNLVRLLGFCYEGTERLLVYEFVPNASLDHFIFDSSKHSFLDWTKRYKIIGGVARGLLYLHEDSRLRIIHRDLKASNVLLDADMNPKIADFGMARLFDIDETQGNTSRIVGTYGYMAPEYAMYGQFSVKSDVFSFGILVLEIVSGQRNNCFRYGENVEDLASSAWLYIKPILSLSRQSCVKDSIKYLREQCTNQKEAVEWYYECMLRYSDSPIINNLVTEPTRVLVNGNNASNQVQYNKDLRDLVEGLRGQAIQRKFATGNISGPDFLTIFALMQCTPDLSSTQCSDCLDEAIREIATLCFGLGCHIMKPSCRLRYEYARFFNDTTTTNAPPPRPQLPPTPPSAPHVAGKGDEKTQTVIIIVAVIVGFVILLLLLVCIIKRKRRRKTATMGLRNEMEDVNSTESLQYDFGTVEVATNHFSSSNKIGEGGFGAVYKGTLQNGEEIAVKRLSTGSNQGQHEFKNEVILVAKLQHRNLVRLLGFCFKGTERLLIYEFVPNASLDHFMFDSVKRSFMDWEKRYKIIGGIARGLLYLHEDSRLRIIHRELKASNVLLDAEMNPKIADFGMARLFNLDETQGFTNKIVGTYGYMAPEYAMHGQFSVKSDVFSFGILVLEILSGQKNHNFRNGENVEDLASFTWKNWREGTASNILDPILKYNSAPIREMIRCIHIGLLCVQENVTSRPTMASVMLMLNSFSLTLEDVRAGFLYTK